MTYDIFIRRIKNRLILTRKIYIKRPTINGLFPYDSSDNITRMINEAKFKKEMIRNSSINAWIYIGPRILWDKTAKVVQSLYLNIKPLRIYSHSF